MTSRPSWTGTRATAFLSFLLLALIAAALTGCGNEEPATDVVVVYTALDREYSEPILDRFEAQTGIRVLAKYDAEAAKTTGLINQVIARQDDPECDVLWNNELVQTVHLARLGLLAPYASPQTDRFPASVRDPQDRWTGFAGRARVIIYNTDRLTEEQAPRSLDAFTDPAWRGEGAIALPFYGTTFTHMSMLDQAWGPDRLEQWLEAARANDVVIAAGNGPVRDMVAAGELAFGLTDTDDAHGAMIDGKPVAVLAPDAEQGLMVIPNTVALIANAPHPEAGRKLIDYLLSPAVEAQLAAARSAQIPLGDGVDLPEDLWPTLRQHDIRAWDVESAASRRDAVVALLRQVGFDQ